jgi:hypothetical protein
MSRIYRHLSAAIEAANKSTGNIRHGAILVIGGKVVSIAFNTPTRHAEDELFRPFLKGRCEKQAESRSGFCGENLSKWQHGFFQTMPRLSRIVKATKCSESLLFHQ